MNHKFAYKALVASVCVGCALFSTSFAASTGKVNASNVNFRQSSSLSSKVIAKYGKGQAVTVNSVSGEWSNVTIDGKTGYMYNNYITVDGQSSSSSSSNLDYGSGLLKVGSRGSSVTSVQTRLKQLGFFKVAATGYYGHITKDAVIAFQKANGLTADGIVGPNVRTKLNSSSTGSSSSSSSSNSSSSSSSTTQSGTYTVTKTAWSSVNGAIPRGANVVVYDVNTGKKFNGKRLGGSNHIDIEPLTANDTAIKNQIYGGSWSWLRRSIVVIYNGKAYAASMNGMPHGTQNITSNGYNGHFCIHFYESKTHGTNKVCPDHKAAVEKAAAVGTIKA